MREAEFLCGRIAFLKEGEILATGPAGELKRLVRLGDLVRIEFTGRVLEEEILRAEGVINLSVSGNVCEVIVDDAEGRLGPLLATLSRSGVQVRRVSMEQTDLERVFIEFAKDTDPDLGLRL
jgi:ABC-type multidrug transport system ATPase subunit